LPFPPGAFDAIVCGDILEHLREPEPLLRRARTWLAPDGCIVASIPNVRHHSVVRSLLEGNWTYESAGLLDRTHLRFFTRREIEKLFFRAGFMIGELNSVIAPGDQNAMGNGPGSVRLGRIAIDGLSEREVSEYFTYQYLVRARPIPAVGRGLTSIVIVTHNQLDYTRQCLDSIVRLTDEPVELIVVDNGSTDGTVEYLRGIPDVHLIVNASNRGFPAAVNQGIAVASGRQILLLNNDVIVTTGWLCRLLQAFERDPAIGLAGPCSNFVSGPQQVAAAYESLGDLDGFAWDWGGANHGRIIDVDRLVGFCLLIRRSVVDAIGMLDERFGIGCFEDDDYCLRAIRAGYRAVIAADAFVHHFGGRTFIGSGVDSGAILRENERKFREKWSRSGDSNGTHDSSAPAPLRLAAPAGGAAFAVAMEPGGGLRVRRKRERPRLSLCMIVRDNARTLAACLESIRPWVDEMVIVDTGSQDETPRIVESFGARLYHFPWPDSFSIARNESLRHAQGEWLFWMDSDDTITPECGRKLRGLVDREPPADVFGYVMQVHCPGIDEHGEPVPDMTVVDHVKLFRNRPDLRFDGRIHEQVLPAIRAAGGEVAWTDIYVIHSGSDQSAAAQAVKRQRDLRLLELELANRPEHPFTLFNLGMTHVHGSRFEEAIGYLERGIAQSGPDEPHLRKAYALLMFARMKLGRHEEALATCRLGRAMFPRDTELRFREGVLLHELGRLAESRQAYLDVLNGSEERHFASVDQGLRGFKSRQNLAVLAADMGDLAEAERQWREVVREAPRYRQGWRGLAETLARSGNIAAAYSVADQLVQDDDLRVEGLLIKSRAAVRLGRLDVALTALNQAATIAPDDRETLGSRCQFLFEHGSADEAESALRTLLDRDPGDASAYHNLGTLLLRSRRHHEAVKALGHSLSLRPDHAATHLNLGYALKDSGRIDQAVLAWKQALRLAPNDLAARQELARLGSI
jgi:GT2 family glycosyltransferase/tetratricopeptide (TPR) repeat protein